MAITHSSMLTTKSMQWVLSIWSGEKALPPKKDMLEDGDAWYNRRLRQALPPHLAGHFFGSCHAEMIDHMAQLGGIKSQDPVLKMLLDEVDCRKI